MSLPPCCSQVLNDPLQLAFSAIPSHPYTPTSTGIKSPADALPPNIHLLTLKWLGCSTVLVRLSHMFQAGEHLQHSKQAAVDLQKLLDLSIVSVQEATLFGERLLAESDLQRPEYKYGKNLAVWDPPRPAAPAALSYTSNRLVGEIPAGTKITLNAMQVRTFFVTVKRTQSRCADQPQPVRKVATIVTVEVGGGAVSSSGGLVARLGAVARGLGGSRSWMPKNKVLHTQSPSLSAGEHKVHVLTGLVIGPIVCVLLGVLYAFRRRLIPSRGHCARLGSKRHMYRQE